MRESLIKGLKENGEVNVYDKNENRVGYGIELNECQNLIFDESDMSRMVNLVGEDEKLVARLLPSSQNREMINKIIK